MKTNSTLRKLLFCLASFFTCEFCLPSFKKEDRPFFVNITARYLYLPVILLHYYDENGRMLLIYE